MGSCQPTTTVLDNKFIEDLNVGTNVEWITDKIGVQTRVTTLPVDYISKTRNADPFDVPELDILSSVDLAVNAARVACQRAGISPQQLGMIIVNCCCPSSLIPSEANRIADKLGADCNSYEVFTACPAFALQCDYLNNFRESELPEYVLCISTATMTQHVNYNDRTDGAIWGDGAAAWIVSARHPGKLKIVDTAFYSDPSRASAVVVNTLGHFWQDGRAVRDFSVRQTVRLIKRLEDQYNIDWNKDVFVGHQANATMLRQITDNREVPASNHWHNVTHLGNQAGAGAPAVISENWEKIQPGMRIVVAVVGAGLSWGSVMLEGI